MMALRELRRLMWAIVVGFGFIALIVWFWATVVSVVMRWFG